ncbi:hypothetical protein JVU11DRAFT_8078 [Chiua virens]|nr:hypothetical protein JVU11DRAFT_8078 [Chiua virens]
MYTYPSTILSAITTTLVCAIYTNTLLANLNAREAVREAGAMDGGTDTFRFTVSGLPVSGGNEHEKSKTSKSSPTPSKVHIYTICFGIQLIRCVEQVGIVPGEDAWQPMKEVTLENVIGPGKPMGTKDPTRTHTPENTHTPIPGPTRASGMYKNTHGYTPGYTVLYWQ